MVLAKAPLAEGVVFPESRLVLYGTGDLFGTLPAAARPSFGFRRFQATSKWSGSSRSCEPGSRPSLAQA